MNPGSSLRIRTAKRRTVNIWTGSGTKRVIKLRRDAVMPHASCIREFGEFGEGDSESDAYQHTYPFPSAGASSMNGNGQGRGPGTILSAIPVIPFIPSVSAIEDQSSDAERHISAPRIVGGDCVDCGLALPTGRKYRCVACAAQAS